MWFSVIHQQESAIGTPCPLSSRSLPSHLPPYLILQPAVEPLFEFRLPYSKFPLAICYTHGIVSFYVPLSIHLPVSLLPSHLPSHCVHRSVPDVCFSTAALKINSSVPSLQIPYMCVGIWYLFFITILNYYYFICLLFIIFIIFTIITSGFLIGQLTSNLFTPNTVNSAAKVKFWSQKPQWLPDSHEIKIRIFRITYKACITYLCLFLHVSLAVLASSSQFFKSPAFVNPMGPPLPSTIHPLTHSPTHLSVHPSNQYVLNTYSLPDALRIQGWTSKEKDKTILGTAATIVKKDKRRTWVEGLLYVGPSGGAWGPGRPLCKYLEWEWSGQLLWQTTPKSQPLNTSSGSLSLSFHTHCGCGGPALQGHMDDVAPQPLGGSAFYASTVRWEPSQSR